MTEQVPAPYTARAIKATGLLDETRILLREWRPGESLPDLRQRVLSTGLLGKATASRAHDVVTHAFGQRFLAPEGPPAQHLKRLLEAKGSGDWLLHLFLLYAARNDVVLSEAATRYARERTSSGRPWVDRRSLERFLEEQEAAGRMARPWSPAVRSSVARHVLRQMTDFGLAGPPTARGLRRLRRLEVSPTAAAYLAYDLHFGGAGDASIVAHPDWAVWLCDEPTVREQMRRLARPELWEFQAAGSVVQVTWTCSSMQEAVDELARLDLS